MSLPNMTGKRRPLPTGSYSLYRSFIYAFSGIWHALRHERNLRIDFAAAAGVIYFSRYYQLDSTQWAIVVLLLGFVICCELINTAIENTVDLETPVYNSLAKVAKDVAAGAVLVSAITSAVAGFFLFWDTAILAEIWRDISSAPFVWVPVAVAAVLWVGFPQKKRRY